MTMPEYEYHIYAKGRCLYHCLPEEEFKEKWEMLNHMVGLMKTEYEEADLSYTQLTVKPLGHGAGSLSVESASWEEDSY